MKLPHPLIRDALWLCVAALLAAGWALDHKRLARENLNLLGDRQAARTAAEQARFTVEIMAKHAKRAGDEGELAPTPLPPGNAPPRDDDAAAP